MFLAGACDNHCLARSFILFGWSALNILWGLGFLELLLNWGWSDCPSSGVDVSVLGWSSSGRGTGVGSSSVRKGMIILTERE